jgi:hypothetical protein
MSHSIKAPRSDLLYAVVDDDGTPRSWHRTEEAAQAAVDAELSRFRRRYPHNTNSYLPRSIVHTRTNIERGGTYSTWWHNLRPYCP